jgi:hypothetical protein
MVPAAANGEPAFAAYLRGDDGIDRAHAGQALTVTRSGLARIVRLGKSADQLITRGVGSMSTRDFGPWSLGTIRDRYGMKDRGP